MIKRDSFNTSPGENYQSQKTNDTESNQQSAGNQLQASLVIVALVMLSCRVHQAYALVDGTKTYAAFGQSHENDVVQ